MQWPSLMKYYFVDQMTQELFSSNKFEWNGQHSNGINLFHWDTNKDHLRISIYLNIFLFDTSPV